jgi:hypothetical protein
VVGWESAWVLTDRGQNDLSSFSAIKKAVKIASAAIGSHAANLFTTEVVRLGAQAVSVTDCD